MTTDTIVGDTPPADRPFEPKRVLNIGCGPKDTLLPAGLFPPGAWREVRLDIDPSVEPDILASITDMAPVADASFDAVWSSHNFEHLFAHEVPLAARECLRVLKPGGRLVVCVPDLRKAAEEILAERLDKAMYVSGVGPITPLDMLYGHGVAIAAGRHYMAHRTGFTGNSLGRMLNAAGFDPVLVRRSSPYDLAAMAFRPPVPAEVLAEYGLPPAPESAPAAETAPRNIP